MKYLPLIWAALWRRRVRAILTLLSITIAFLLFGMMIGLNASFDYILSQARADRINVNPRFDSPLTMSMAAELERMPGIAASRPGEFYRRLLQGGA